MGIINLVTFANFNDFQLINQFAGRPNMPRSSTSFIQTVFSDTKSKSLKRRMALEVVDVLVTIDSQSPHCTCKISC